MTYGNLIRIGGTALGALALLGAAGCGGSNAAAAPTSTTAPSGASSAAASYHGATIVVAGHGVATGTPDTMTMSIGVRSTAPSAQAALDQNNQEATSLQHTLEAKGVLPKDMQTNDLSISPNYDNHGHVTGYSVSNMVTVTLHSLDRAGDVIDAGAAAVGNDITLDGVQLSIGDTSSYLRQARMAAVQQAIGHAKQEAEAAGLKLGAVRKIDDTGSTVPQPEFYAQAAAGIAAPSVPISAGTQQLSVDVVVTFAVTNA